ncbi:MAG: hypothetical protein KG003_07795 [Bacteroidetes bacterium]|nr:hypothetical protein [Bacteroidota bacterium]
MKPERIHVVRNEGKPDIPNKPSFEGLAAKAAIQMATPWWSHWLTYTSGGVAVVAGIFGVVHYNKNQSVELPKPKVITTVNTVTVKPFVTGFDTLNVDLINGDTILYKGCTKIIIPPSSITSADGGKLDNTQLLYREMRNAADWIAADVKLEYPNKEGMVMLESNGMFEIKTLHSEIIHPQKQITIAFCTNHTKPDNHWYQSKNDSESWSYLQKAVYHIQQEKGMALSTNQADEVARLETKQKPARPKMRDLHNHAFDIDLSFIPELSKYKNVTFEVIPGQKYFPEELPEVMDKIKVIKSEIVGQYLVSFYDNGTIHRFQVYPVFTNESEYKMAMKEYKVAMDVYRQETNLDISLPAPADQIITETKLPVSEIKIKKFGLYQVAKSQLHAVREIANDKSARLFKKINGLVYQIFLNKNTLHRIENKESVIALRANENCVLLAKNMEGKWTYSDLRNIENRTAFDEGMDPVWVALDASLDSVGEINHWMKGLSGKASLQ